MKKRQFGSIFGSIKLLSRMFLVPFQGVWFHAVFLWFHSVHFIIQVRTAGVMTNNTLIAAPPSTKVWKTVNAKVRSQDLPILNNRLKVYGFETLGDLVKDFIAGKFPQVTDDKQIDGLKNNLQGTGQFSALNGTFQPDFYKSVNYQDMHRYYEKLRHYSYGYARELTSYYRRYAEQFFKEPESLHTAVSNPKRAWILNAMRAFAVYWEYKTQGGKEIADLVYNIIRRYQLNRGLDMHHKIYLVDENHLSEKIKLLMAVPGDLGFVIKLGLFSGLREEELLYAYDNRAMLQTVQKRNGTLTVIILNRFQAKKNAYFTILPTSIWVTSNLYLPLVMKSTFPARTK